MFVNWFLGKILFWGIAQLGERLNGIQEVSGSIPLISTKNKDSCSQERYMSPYL